MIVVTHLASTRAISKCTRAAILRALHAGPVASVEKVLGGNVAVRRLHQLAVHRVRRRLLVVTEVLESWIMFMRRRQDGRGGGKLGVDNSGATRSWLRNAANNKLLTAIRNDR